MKKDIIGMMKRFAPILLVTMIAAGGLLYWKTSYPAHCQVCDRAGCKALTFGLKKRWGIQVRTCCPRCGFHYGKSHQGTQITYATDFTTGEKIDAGSAVYVEGSSVHFCEEPQAIRDEIRGTSAYLKFDRCLPSVIAFAKKEDAQAFKKSNGGTLLTFNDLKGKI